MVFKRCLRSQRPCYLGVEPLLLLTGQQLHTPGGAIVLINGTILGVHRQPETFAANFRLLRRWGPMNSARHTTSSNSFRTLDYQVKWRSVTWQAPSISPYLAVWASGRVCVGAHGGGAGVHRLGRRPRVPPPAHHQKRAAAHHAGGGRWMTDLAVCSSPGGTVGVITMCHYLCKFT